jgi:hypothetical protein
MSRRDRVAPARNLSGLSTDWRKLTICFTDQPNGELPHIAVDGEGNQTLSFRQALLP